MNFVDRGLKRILALNYGCSQMIAEAAPSKVGGLRQLPAGIAWTPLSLHTVSRPHGVFFK